MKKKFLVALLFGSLLALVPAFASAQDGLVVNVETDFSCDGAQFSIAIEGGSAPYSVLVDYGDGSYDEQSVEVGELVLEHTYSFQGEYPWSVSVEDALGAVGSASGTALLSGPEVSLGSTPFPPLLTLEEGEASASFTASVFGGSTPYAFEWDLDGDGAWEEGFDGPEANFTYTAGGEYEAKVRVTDTCGFVEVDTLTVVVDDPEEDPEGDCHPTAQKIAEAVSSLFPDQAEQVYTCKDIFDIFEGALTGYQLGFGRMWHAYQLSQTMEELTWEQILDWQLNTGGWGLLAQLNRYGDLLEQHSLVELVALVASEEYSMNDVRGAVRAATRFDADFDDALERISAGVSFGELGQFYKLAQELGEEPAVLDEYLEEGHSLADLRHSAKFAERMGVEWDEIATAFDAAGSWGDVNQAYRLANDDYSAEDILAMGVKEYRALERDENRAEREQQRADDTAQKIAQQFQVEVGEVLALFNADCDGNWGCVRKALREQTQTQSQGTAPDKSNRTAQQIASKYGVSQGEVMSVFEGTCSGDWSCTRAHFRDAAKPDRGKPDK
ncbi:MAG: PKD domain-containing protein [Anaerolineales bacterium]